MATRPPGKLLDLGSHCLSSFRLMWMIVFFDLPVTTKLERKAATVFRNQLLERGFHMAQYSVYIRLLSGKEAVEAMARSIQHDLPRKGKVEILAITDRQYENIIAFENQTPKEKRQPEQLQLF